MWRDTEHGWHVEVLMGRDYVDGAERILWRDHVDGVLRGKCCGSVEVIRMVWWGRCFTDIVLGVCGAGAGGVWWWGQVTGGGGGQVATIGHSIVSRVGPAHSPASLVPQHHMLLISKTLPFSSSSSHFLLFSSPSFLSSVANYVPRQVVHGRWEAD